jgi:hypothetical protein
LFRSESYDKLGDDKKGEKVETFVDKSKLNARAEMILKLTQELKGLELRSVLSKHKESGLMTREVYDKYIEAVGLIKVVGAVSIKDALDFESVARNLCSNDVSRNKMGQIAGDFVHAHKGASVKIISFIQEKRLLTS